MRNQSPIIWTPFQRQAVIDFLKLYTKELEETKEDPEEGYGLANIQKGVLHLADKVLPSGVRYVVNDGPQGAIYNGVHIIYSDEEAQEFENARSGEADD